MPRQRVPEATTFNMIGPYLTAEVTCPHCSFPNVLLHTEGPVSPVKPFEVCRHIRAYGVDDEGIGFFEFEDVEST